MVCRGPALRCTCYRVTITETVVKCFRTQEKEKSSGRGRYASMRRKGDILSCDLENFTLDEFVRHLECNRNRVGAFDKLLQMYRIARRFPDMSNFRLGPNMFERIPLDWLILAHGSTAPRRSELVAHAIASRIDWNGEPMSLPRGWQRTVRYCYENVAQHKRPANTLVGLFINVEQEFRRHGWAARVIEGMKDLARRRSLTSIVIPLRLPTRYERHNAAMPFEEFAFLKRDDGEYRDHWLRLHVRLGARVIGHCNTSHQHAMNLDDFYQQFELDGGVASGCRVARRHDEWYEVYINVECDYVVINQGCVWVEYAIDSSSQLDASHGAFA